MGVGLSAYSALRLDYFNNMVRLNAPWDYKQQGKQFGAANPYEAGGNFNFGATGAAMGLSTQVLLRGAGFAQTQSGNGNPAFGSPFGAAPYGDDPRDQAQIMNGIAYYENCRKP